MTTRVELRDLVVSILTGATMCGDRVYAPGDWPTWDGVYPVARVSAPRERKGSQGRGGSDLFTVTGTIRVTVTVEAPADAVAWGEMDAEAALEPVEQRILALIVGNPAIRQKVSQFPEIVSQIAVSPEGLDNLGELQVDLDMEFVQGPADFWDPAAVPLAQVAIGWRADPTADGPGGTAPDLGIFVQLDP